MAVHAMLALAVVSRHPQALHTTPRLAQLLLALPTLQELMCRLVARIIASLATTGSSLQQLQRHTTMDHVLRSHALPTLLVKVCHLAVYVMLDTVEMSQQPVIVLTTTPPPARL